MGLDTASLTVSTGFPSPVGGLAVSSILPASPHPAPLTIDTALYPYAGPCAFCGRPDKRHRLFDAIRENHRAGDGIEFLSEAYDLPVASIEWVVAQKRFPGRRAS